ncbi:KAT8 regulatory NSL complex subunit 1-like protein isoform 2-T2 [Pholidichthys leucotaenia]
MALALTKALKNGHGIHLSTPPAPVTVDSDRRAVCSVELKPHMRLTEDGDLRKMLLNLSSFHSLDSCVSSSFVDAPASPVIYACVQSSNSRCELAPLPSPGSVISFLSLSKGLRDSHQVASVFPGVTDMFLDLSPEHNSKAARMLDGASANPECLADGVDVLNSSHTETGICPSYFHVELKPQTYNPLITTPDTQTRQEVSAMCNPHPHSVQLLSGKVNVDELPPKPELEDPVKARLCKQAGLQCRAWRLQKRLHVLLGEHALEHCSRQLEGLKRHCQRADGSLDCLDPACHDVASLQTGSSLPHFSWPELSSDSSLFTEVREFSRSSQETLRELEEALDSEATASSSSSDEESEEDTFSRTVFHGSSCKRQWLEERAELSSRWSWLELRLVDLEGKIQQLVALHKHITSTKGRVVLADSQPLTDRQIQQTLLREMAGLSYTASDAETEPCSPARLLRNIERQSAQLSQIVNSLMPPLSFSPLSKQPQVWNGKTPFTSGHNGDSVFVPGSLKRRSLGTRRLHKADMTFVCARTRPLLTYHKPRLFMFNSHCPGSPVGSGESKTLFSSISSSSCSCCSSCDPVNMNYGSDCRVLSSSATGSRVQLGTAMCPCLRKVTGREEWSQSPLAADSSAHYMRRSSTPLHNSHKYKEHWRRHKNSVMGLSPIRFSGSAPSRNRVYMRRRKRRRVCRLQEDEEDVLYQLCDLEDSSDDVLEESYMRVSHKQTAQGFVRKRQNESVYNIDNIVIPASLAKIEKLTYKDILIPSWRGVGAPSLIEMDAENEEGKVEDLSDEVFAQRHLALEQREKMRWFSWQKRKRCRRPARFGSRLSGGGGGMYTSGEESSVEWSSTQQDSDDTLRSEEWLPQNPWEPRVFPLNEDDEATLFCDEEEVTSGCTEICSACSTSKSATCQLFPNQSSCVTLPSYGQQRSCTPSCS